MSATIDTWLAAATCLFARTAYRAPKQVGFQHVCALLIVESKLLSRLWPNLLLINKARSKWHAKWHAMRTTRMHLLQ